MGVGANNKEENLEMQNSIFIKIIIIMKMK
jgi:hypothetical protein